jgi:hypothetical protein
MRTGAIESFRRSPVVTACALEFSQIVGDDPFPVRVNAFPVEAEACLVLIPRCGLVAPLGGRRPETSEHPRNPRLVSRLAVEHERLFGLPLQSSVGEGRENDGDFFVVGNVAAIP